MSLLYFIFCTPGICHSHLSPLCFTSPQKTVGSEVTQIGQIKYIGIGFVGEEDQKKITKTIKCVSGAHFLARCGQNLLQTNLSLSTLDQSMPGRLIMELVFGVAEKIQNTFWYVEVDKNIFRVQLSFSPGSAVASATPTGNNDPFEGRKKLNLP